MGRKKHWKKHATADRTSRVNSPTSSDSPDIIEAAAEIVDGMEAHTVVDTANGHSSVGSMTTEEKSLDTSVVDDADTPEKDEKPAAPRFPSGRRMRATVRAAHKRAARATGAQDDDTTTSESDDTTGDRTTEAVQDAREHASEKMQDAREYASEKTRDAMNYASEKTQAAKEYATEKAQNAKSYLSEKTSAAVEAASGIAQDVATRFTEASQAASEAVPDQQSIDDAAPAEQGNASDATDPSDAPDASDTVDPSNAATSPDPVAKDTPADQATDEQADTSTEEDESTKQTANSSGETQEETRANTTYSSRYSSRGSRRGGFWSNVRSSISMFFSSNANSIIYGIAGIITAILIIAIGFWRALLIVALCAVGVIYGRYRDGDPATVAFFRRLFR